MPVAPESNRWSNEQLNSARAIISVGRSLGATDRDLMVALMAAFQESGLRNLNYGDRDSIGLFQQRNAWGSRAERLDPVKAARMFFLGGHQGQRGLLDFKNRDNMSLTQAAQAVQVSAFPDAYAKHEGQARALLAELAGVTGDQVPHATTVDDSLAPSTGESQVLADMGEQIAAPGTEAVTDALGLGAATAPGTESADQRPDMSMSFLGNFGEAEEGQSFEDYFPKAPGVNGGARARALQIAKGLLGTPYVWGGSNPDSGLDCSGFTQYVLGQVGVHLPRISAQQARYGARVGLNQLKPGDLVGWDNSARNNGADHIAIWLGNGQIIESPRPGLGVRIRSLDDNEGAWGVSLSY
jgi:cell wall-associated NlpC family hydrolase